MPNQIPWCHDFFLQHQNSYSNTNNLISSSYPAKEWKTSVYHMLLLNWKCWCRTIFENILLLWFSTKHSSAWKHKKLPASLDMRVKRRLIKLQKSRLTFTYPPPFSQPELESYWVTCKILITVSQKAQWTYPGSPGRFSSIFTSNKISLSALLRVQWRVSS